MTSIELVLPEKIDLLEIKRLQEQLIAATQGSTSIQVNAHQVKYIDVSGMQVLAAFVKLCHEKKIAMEWSECTEEFKACVSLLGFSDLVLY